VIVGEEDATESTNRRRPVITGDALVWCCLMGLRDDAGDEGNIDGDHRALARKRPEPGRAAWPISTTEVSAMRAAGAKEPRLWAMSSTTSGSTRPSASGAVNGRPARLGGPPVPDYDVEDWHSDSRFALYAALRGRVKGETLAC